METNAYRGRLNGPHETATPGPAVSVSSSLALSRMAPSSAALAILLAIFSLTLAACGGGGGGGGAKPAVKKQFTEVEDTVSASPIMQVPSYALGLAGADNAGGSGGYKGQGVTVAVIDGEFDVEHPDVSQAFQRDTNGHVIGRNVAEGHDDVRPVERRLSSPRADIKETTTSEEKQTVEQDNGYNFSRSISHGTHVAGIIGARENGFGTVGIAPEAKIVPITLFRDFDRPDYRYGLSNLNSQSLADWNGSLAKSVDFATAKKPFVINNSWGWSWFHAEINSTSGGYGYRYYFRLPNFFLRSDPRQRMELHRQIFSRDAISAWERAVDGGAAVVFAAGNDGWNSETGRHKIYSKPVRGRNWQDYRNEKHERYIRTIVRRIGVESEGGTPIDVPANIPGLESSYFLANTKLRGAWLAVVAVDKRRVITRWSNGCGIAKDYCLAAPGMHIRSTLARGDQDDVADRPEDRNEISSYGDVDYETGDGFGTLSGTSMAAPIVSGALAVLKSKHPQMTARQAVKAVLCTATELRESGRTGVTKRTDDAAVSACAASNDTGNGLTYIDGWTPSEVYGHGLLNLARALQPIGPTRAAAAGAFGVAAAADTRVAFSSAFGNAAPSQELDFGGLDMFGRVYRFRAPLQDRVMPGPRLAGVMAMTAPPPPVVMGRGDGVTTLLRRSTNVDSAIGDGGVISYLGARSRTDLALVNRRTGGGAVAGGAVAAG
jgi:subtilisin family serine protease